MLGGSLKTETWDETTDQRMSRLMREAADLQPVRKPLFGEDKIDTRMRTLFKEVINANKDYQAAVNRLDTSAINNLIIPKSFADPSSASAGLQQMHAAYALDALQEQRMQTIAENLKKSFDDFSPSERETATNGFDAGLAQVMPVRQRAITTEKAWMDAVDDVYDYARSHHSAFTISSGHVAISDNAVREKFNSRIRTMNSRRAEFLRAKAELANMQNHNLEKMGLSHQQIGLDK